MSESRRQIEMRLRAAGRSHAEAKRIVSAWRSLQLDTGTKPMSSTLSRALAKFAPRYRNIAELSHVRSILDLKRARLAIAEGPDPADASGFEGDMAMARTAIAELDTMIDRAERAQDADRRTARPVEGQDAYGGSRGGWGGAPLLRDVATGRAIRTFRHDEPMASDGGQPDWGLGDMVRASVTGDWSRLPSHTRAGAAGIGASGGYLIPSELAGFVVDLARARARVLQAGAQTVPMQHGTLTIATVASDPQAAWKAENAAFAVSQGAYGELVLSQKTLGVIVPLSLELVMSASNVNELVTTQLTKALALMLDQAAISGDGTLSTPRGITSWLPSGAIFPVSASLASATAYGHWTKAIGSCLAANAELDRLSILHNSDVETALDGLQDTLYQPLRATPNFAAIKNSGKVYIANGILTSGSPAATYSVVGDFSQVLFGMQQNLILEISREGSYGPTGSTGNAFAQGQVLVRALIMCDVAILRPTFFAQVSDIRIP
jgi:HK97 family phage major capsid protein